MLASKYQVTAVSSGVEAVAELGRSSFGAIVSDIDMPGMSGIELLEALRTRAVSVPVVLVTGWPSFETAQRAVNHGAYQYLTKPVDAARLHEVLLRATSNGGASNREALEARFERALAGAFAVFQPIVHFADRATVGYEALLRTDEPSLARPPDFIGVAEQLGRLPDLGRTVRAAIGRAIPDAPPEARIFVNLHARDLEEADLFDVDSPLGRHASRVVLELTERTSLESITELSSITDRLRALGYSIAIDDLGAGYAGLTSLSQVEPDVVKLDMSLVRGIDKSQTKQHVVRSMAKVCHELGMTVVTEGVETAHERDVLLELGCDIFQGYLFGRPQRGFVAPTF